MALTESQILLLNNIIYRSEFSKPENLGLTIEEIFLKGVSNSEQQAMTPEEWDQIYAMVASDPVIKNLKVVSSKYEKETGAKMACFVDPRDGQAYAVFAGTGANEWRDDAVAGKETDSIQQQKALAWFNSLEYKNIIVSGHSKGGNKAMYVAIVSDNVAECYAFDGEGFSNEFLVKYREQIQEKASRIHLRANSRDFVNILLNYIPGIDIKYVHNNRDGIATPKDYHSPNALFLYEDGKIVYQIGNLTDYQDPMMEMLHEFTVYLLNNASDAELILALSVLGELLTQFLGGENGIVREDILEMFGVEGLEIVLRYLTKYLQDLKVSDPDTYNKYRDAFRDFAGDAANGGDFFSYLLSNLVVGPITGEVFDWLTNGTILRIYRTVEHFKGGNVRGRDFTRNAKEKMLSAAKETEDEPWWRVDRWDCWYRAEKAFGGMKWDQYTGRIDEYYRKLIDINEASVKDIEKIFEKVYQLDDSYSQTVSNEISELNTRVEQILARIGSSIVVGC